MSVAVVRPLLAVLAALMLLAGAASPALAISADDLPAALPEARVLDTADVLSRAARAELDRQLADLAEADRLEARLVTLPRLDYGLSLPALAGDLVQRWSTDGPANLLLIVIESQNKSATVAVSDGLSRQLPAGLLRSTARETMGTQLREGARYRQASLEALDRLATVLASGEDPGPPEVAEAPLVATNVPTREETAESNAFTWVVVLLVVGSVVPMVTWWVFSR
jgi:uncharacterized protein